MKIIRLDFCASVSSDWFWLLVWLRRMIHLTLLTFSKKITGTIVMIHRVTFILLAMTFMRESDITTS